MPQRYHCGEQAARLDKMEPDHGIEMHHRSKPAEARVTGRDSNSEEEHGYKANNTETPKVPSRQLDVSNLTILQLQRQH